MCLEKVKRLLGASALLLLLLGRCAGDIKPPAPSPMPACQAHTLPACSRRIARSAALPPATPPVLPALPSDWYVAASAWADVTGDGVPEWVLLVWRPWRDWPIQRWSSVPSPIAGYHDAAGDSCHLILLNPQDGREIWAGSALPVPLLALAVEDVDGDGIAELVTLEGSYAGGRDGPATHVDVWGWNGFGFTLQRRSPLKKTELAQTHAFVACRTPRRFRCK